MADTATNTAPAVVAYDRAQFAVAHAGDEQMLDDEVQIAYVHVFFFI